MARLQWCREHIDEVQEACGLSNSAKLEVKQAAKFCVENSDFAEVPTRPILALIRVRDDNVRDRAILWAKNALNPKTHVGKNKKESLTEKEIKKIIQKAETEIRSELGQLYKENELGQKQCGDVFLDGAPTEIALPVDLGITHVIKEKQPRNKQPIDETLSHPFQRFDAVIEQFIADFPYLFPTKESVVAAALDSLTKEMRK